MENKVEINCEYLMSLLASVLRGESSLDSIKGEINEDIKDKDNNGVYHYFAQYSLEKFYMLNYNKDKVMIIKQKEFENIKKQYIEQIPLYIDNLDDLNCDCLSPNKNNQTPLMYSIIHKNYDIAKQLMEKIHNMYIMQKNDYYNIFNLTINRGDCLRDDCIDFISYMLTLEDENGAKIFNEKFLNSENTENCLTPIVILCKDYSENIYKKINSIIEMVGSNYNENYYDIMEDEELKQGLFDEILYSTRDKITDFINQKFYPLLRDFIKLGADINYIENYQKQNAPKSAFMYLMSYPCFNNISEFVKNNRINLNYRDESGQTALICLINSKEKIVQITENLFKTTLNYFLNENDTINIGITDNNGMSAFGLCLMKGYFNEAYTIYVNQKFEKEQHQFNIEILIFIINYLNQKNEYTKILNLLSIFGQDLKTFNTEHKRTLLHYICMYAPDNNIIFENLFLEINKLYQNFEEKDIFNRNALFYLFIDEDEKIKSKEPYIQLGTCLNKIDKIDINEVDVFGNSLLFYAVQARAYNSIKLLLKHKASLDLKNNEGNTIYTTAVILEDFKLFSFLYNLKKDNKIFNQKIYSSKQIELYRSEKRVGQLLLNFYKKTNTSFNSRVFIEELEKDFEINYNNMTYNSKDKSSKYVSEYINLLCDSLIVFLSEMINDLKIKNDDKNKVKFYVNYNNCFHTKERFLKNLNEFINKTSGEKSSLLSENMFRFCKSKKNEQFCRFMINEDYNLISICNDLLSLNYEDELHYFITQVLYEKDLLSLTNEENITIFHILAKFEKNQSFYKEENLEEYDISNLFDKSGNTPIYYACQECNIYFIETFSKYSFESKNEKEKVNYSLFGESQNGENIPLKALYHNLNKNDMNVLKLIIDLSLEMKKAYISDIFISLVENYSNKYNEFWTIPYKDNIDSEDYAIKVMGLYLFYKNELNGAFELEEFNGINPVFYCLEHKNFDFLFDGIVKEKKIDINCRNKDRKNIFHLIIEMEEDSDKKFPKSEVLKRVLNYTDQFNIKDLKGMLPIDYAYLNKDNDCINILINNYNKKGFPVPEDKNK